MLTGILPVILYLFWREKIRNYSLIIIYLLLSILTDLVLSPLLERIFNSPFLGVKIFTLLEFGLISYFIFINLNSKIKNRLFTICSALFLFVFIFENIISYQQNFNSISTGISALIILLYSVHFLFHRINSNENFSLDIIFTLIVSFVIYFAGTFFIYILTKNNFFDKNFQYLYSLINSIFLMFRNILISVGFFQSVYDKKNRSRHVSSLKYEIK